MSALPPKADIGRRIYVGIIGGQNTGADILRIACIWANRRGIKLCAPVHDAVLIEAPIDRIEADVALMREIMRRASRIVLNAKHDGPYELRTDATIVAYPGRYRVICTHLESRQQYTGAK